MALVNKPDESIFASSAKQGEVDNFPDLLRGWGVTFDQTQGIPPMEWFNFLFKRLDEKHTYLMQRGLPEWSATQDYTKGSCVQFDGVSYRALKDSKNNSPNESDSQYWVRWGFALSEIAQATLTQYGITKLYTGYDSQSEDLALTPKTGYQLKQLIDSNTRALGNVIPNSKKSSAVDSNSADTVATSAAVKTAYDKGVEAKTAADHAQLTANDGVAKANAVNVAFNVLRDLFIGVPIPYPLSTVPTGCLAMNGQRFDTTRYPKLAQKYPSGVLPDLRGEFIRGWDNGRNVDIARGLLTYQVDALQDHVHFLPTVGGDSYEWENDINVFIWDNTSNRATPGAFVHKSAMEAGKRGNNHNIKEGGDVRTYHASKVPSIVDNSYRQRVANETRPRNIAYHYICLAE